MFCSFTNRLVLLIALLINGQGPGHEHCSLNIVFTENLWDALFTQRLFAERPRLLTEHVIQYVY